MHPRDLVVNKFLTPHHFDMYLGFSILLNSMYFHGVCAPRLMTSFAGWTMRVSLLLQAVVLLWSWSHRLYHDCAHAMDCAVLHSHVFGLLHACACSTHGPVTWDSYMTSISPLTILVMWKNLIWCHQSTWCSHEACIETDANLFLRRNSLEQKSEKNRWKSIGTSVMLEDGNLKWSCGHFKVVSTRLGSRVHLSCHVRP